MNEEKKPKLFEYGHSATDFILEWWEELNTHKSDRAEIRRCKNLSEVELTSAYQRFYWRFLKEFKEDLNFFPSKEKTALIVALAVYVSENKSHYKNEEDELERIDYFAYQISRGEKPKLSELRFRRLLHIEDREKLFRFLIQVIRLLDRKVNLLDILKIAFYWNDNTKKSLAYKYYEKANLDN
jgi:CRISPR system Cascade subunit CasB